MFTLCDILEIAYSVAKMLSLLDLPDYWKYFKIIYFYEKFTIL